MYCDKLLACHVTFDRDRDPGKDTVNISAILVQPDCPFLTTKGKKERLPQERQERELVEGGWQFRKYQHAWCFPHFIGLNCSSHRHALWGRMSWQRKGDRPEGHQCPCSSESLPARSAPFLHVDLVLGRVILRGSTQKITLVLPSSLSANYKVTPQAGVAKLDGLPVTGLLDEPCIRIPPTSADAPSALAGSPKWWVS